MTADNPITPITRPLCVVDWNSIQENSDNADVPAEYGLLIPDMILSEIAGKSDEKKRAGHARQFGRWASRNANRLWIGRYWNDVSQQQRPPTTIITLEHLIHPEMTAAVRRLAADPFTDWATAIEQLRGATGEEEYERRRQQFIGWCDELRNLAVEKEKTNGSSDTEVEEWIQNPSLAADYVKNFFTTSFPAQEWREYLARFPDDLAIGVWARIIAYYQYRRAVGDKDKFENNWDDAHYAFLARFTGYIATDDKRLIRLCRLIWPDVKVVNPVPVVKA
jgi:hypothetical protein